MVGSHLEPRRASMTQLFTNIGLIVQNAFTSIGDLLVAFFQGIAQLFTG
jgi:hypothetical protein